MKTITKINKKSFLLKPISNQARKSWEQKIKKMAATHSNKKDKGQLDDLLNNEDDIRKLAVVKNMLFFLKK